MPYTVTITKLEKVNKVRHDRELVKETPTERMQDKSYGCGTERCYEREWTVVEKHFCETESVKVYEQTVENLDLSQVIVAVNRITVEQ